MNKIQVLTFSFLTVSLLPVHARGDIASSSSASVENVLGVKKWKVTPSLGASGQIFSDGRELPVSQTTLQSRLQIQTSIPHTALKAILDGFYNFQANRAPDAQSIPYWGANLAARYDFSAELNRWNFGLKVGALYRGSTGYSTEVRRNYFDWLDSSYGALVMPSCFYQSSDGDRFEVSAEVSPVFIDRVTDGLELKNREIGLGVALQFAPDSNGHAFRLSFEYSKFLYQPRFQINPRTIDQTVLSLGYIL